MNRLNTFGGYLRVKFGAIMRRRFVRWAALCAAMFLVLSAAWTGYRVLGYWSDKRLLNELATAEPSYGYDGASWGAPDLRCLGVTQNSPLFRPNVWGVLHPVFSRVDSVSFRDIADADLERCRGVIERFSHPVALCLVSDKVTDSGLAVVARFRNLDGFALYSSDARISDAGVARLGALPYLETLTLDSHALSAQCVVEVSRFPRLRQITLSGIPVSVSALEALGKMKLLRTLDLRSADVSEEALEKMTDFKDTHPDLDLMY